MALNETLSQGKPHDGRAQRCLEEQRAISWSVLPLPCPRPARTLRASQLRVKLLRGSSRGPPLLLPDDGRGVDGDPPSLDQSDDMRCGSDAAASLLKGYGRSLGYKEAAAREREEKQRGATLWPTQASTRTVPTFENPSTSRCN